MQQTWDRKAKLNRRVLKVLSEEAIEVVEENAVRSLFHMDSAEQQKAQDLVFDYEAHVVGNCCWS